MKKFFKNLKETVQNKPEKSALIVTIIILTPMLIWCLSIIEITPGSVFEMIFEIVVQILIFACVGLMFWFMFAMSFGEK